MELSFNELKKRDVVNVSDGKCYGKITDLTLSFPKGVLTGITVPGSKKNCIMRLLSRSKIFIEERKIIRIGSDVILVDLKCKETCDSGVNMENKKPPAPPCPPPFLPCNNPGNNYAGEDGYNEY